MKQQNQRMVETRSQRKTTLAEAWSCACGGGQSCIVSRRCMGDWIHEDMVFKDADISLRTSCLQPYSVQQENALKQALSIEKDKSPGLFDRWLIDGEIEKSKI